MVKAYNRWLAYREARKELDGLDEATLRDIGIFPGDIHGIAAQEALRRFP